MTKRKQEKVCRLVHELISYLRSLDGEDEVNGQRAAGNFESTLASLESNFERTVGFLYNDVGSKGMLDWSWTETRRRKLEEFSEKICYVILPKWWEFWK